MPVKVLIADDQDMLRKAIRDVLKVDPDIKVVGEAEDFPQVVALIRDLNPHVVVLDLHMPASPNFSFGDIKRAATAAGSKLIAVSVWQDEPSRALATSFGSSTLLDKANLATLLIPAIRQLMATGMDS
ncbi:MAG: response regulator transcription factor [Candidatus Acidiferrales bacterium]